MARVYVDSNVFISLWDHEFGGPTDFLEHYAEEFFNRALSCEFIIVISDLVVEEVYKFMKFNDKEINNSLRPYMEANKLEIVATEEELWQHAHDRIRRGEGTHLADMVHTLVAEREAIPVVTWNIKDFPGAHTPKTI